MKCERVKIRKEMYLWAIERAGYNADEFLRNRPKFAAYVEGEKDPTVNQIEEFAKLVHVPVGYLMLPEPPVETPPIPMFRGKAGNERFDLNVYQTVLDIQGKQEWLSAYLSENELDECPFVGKYSTKTPTSAMAAILRQYLNLQVDWMINFHTPEQAINHLVEQMEEVGVCVFFNGVVGNNTHRTLDVEECRGFALVTDTNAPMIFVNNRDSKTAQLFTLAHEFTHVLVGVSAGYAGIYGAFHNHVEDYCDMVAAEFLVPANLLKENWEGIEATAKAFNVSRVVVARRAYQLNLISSDEYRQFYLRYQSDGNKAKKKSSGGSFYLSAAKRVGKLFAIHIFNAVHSNQLSYTDAYRLTGLYGKTFDTFMANSI